MERDYDKLLYEDVKLKTELKDKLKSAGVSTIEIERPGNKLRIIIKTARPGIIIGRKGAEIDKLKGELQKRTSREVFVDIQEVHKPELDAQLVSEAIALQLEKRVGFRRAMRKAVDSALRTARVYWQTLGKPHKKHVIGRGKQLVAEIIRRVAPHRQADRVELAVNRIIVDDPAAGDLVQPRQRAREVGNAGKRELIERNGGHVVLANLGRP